MNERTLRIYLAAPFFSEGERCLNEIILQRLDPHWRVFYPYRDGVRMTDLLIQGVTPRSAVDQVGRCDFEQIKICDLVIAVLDGRVPDEGVCVEVGLARGLNKDVIGLLTDTRSCFSWGSNPMLSSCLSLLCTDTSHLVYMIKQNISNRAGQYGVATDDVLP